MSDICARTYWYCSVVLALLASAESARAEDHYLYAADVFQSSTNDWTDESEAEGQPAGANCNSTTEFYAYNSTRSSTERLQAIDFQNLDLPPCHVITRVRVNVMCRYDSGFNGRITMRILGSGIDRLIDSDTFQSGPDNCTWVLDGPGNQNDITGLAAWTPALINQLEVRVGRFQSYPNGGTLRIKAFRIVVTSECPSDPDGDGACGSCDNCPDIPNPGQANNDGDVRGNVCDNCPNVHNDGQEDSDGDGVGNA